MNNERLCSHCGYPITERDAVRCYGTHEAHQESQCLELLKATIDRLERERDEATEDYSRRHTEYMDYRYGGVGLPEGAESIIDRLERERDRLRVIESAARVLVTNPHEYLIEDGNYHVEGVPFEALKEALRSPEGQDI